MAPSPLEKQLFAVIHHTVGLMSVLWVLAMDITALCDMCWGENGNDGAVFSVDKALAHHFMAPHPPVSSYAIEVLVVLATQVTSWYSYIYKPGAANIIR